MSLPTRSEAYMKFMDSLRIAQEDAAMLMHIHNTEDNANDKAAARGWFLVSEFLKKMQYQVTQMAKGKMQ